MRSPFTALTWEIWQRNRRTAWLVIGIILFGWLFNLVLPDSFRASAAGRERLMTVNGMLTVASLLLVFGIFNHTEFNPQKDWTGFPYRLFSLPVATWLLVVLPMSLGVAAVELVYFSWMKLVFTHDPLARPGWLVGLIGAYMVFYQTILWSLAGFRILRIIVLGLIGTSFVGVAFLPAFAKYVSSPWLSEKVLIAMFVALSLMAFVISWICVARQRFGGGHRRNWLKALIDRVGDALPRRSKDFSSSVGAQFWFEWRRFGLLLPLCIGAMLILVIGPLSWVMRKDSDSALWVLGWTLAMPVILAAPVGKGFSKPDFWSSDLSLPPSQAVRPLATGEMVVIKMKVAALSAAISWLLVLAFLSVWLPLWADLAPLSMVRIGFWMIYDHSVYPQYLIAALSIIAGMFLTWKFLVGGLWIGLSGNRRFFIASAAVYCLVALVGIISLVVLFEQKAVRAWIRDDPNRLLSYLEWLAALAIILKFWLAAFSWRRISSHRVRKYLLIWLGSMLCLMALAILVWSGGRLYLPLDADRLRNLLVLIVLLVIPFARLGLAPSALARNRHA
jgi:hypothetical protein